MNPRTAEPDLPKADSDPAGQEEIAWADGCDPENLPQEVRLAFADLKAPLEVRPLQGGLLHQSFHLRAGRVEYVLQRVSDVFAPEIHDNIQAVTAHLAERGIPVAPLVPTTDGQLSADLGRLGRWRLMPHLGGASFETLASIEQAHSAGALVGRFHAALRDFELPLAPLGIRYRDTPAYLEAMKAALRDHPDHRLASEMSALGERILATFEQMGSPPEAPLRVIHGDLKLSNLLFEDRNPPGRDVAFALIDLDTLMRGPLWVELGDAWRSWCNRAGEDAPANQFDIPTFEASAKGFFEAYGEGISPSEVDSLAIAPERITLELCARFVSDSLKESYFAWDETKFASRGDHNAARAIAAWDLSESMRDTRGERDALLRCLTD